MNNSPNHNRTLIAIGGDDRIAFLQGILTNDITKLNEHKIQFAAMLSPQGKILHDMFLVAVDNAIILDTATQFKDTLLKRLHMYKLRAKVTIDEITADDARCTSLQPLPDPRHPALPRYSPLNTHLAPLSLGIPELGRDFMPDEVVAADAGYDLLGAVSYTKGCYVGQEVTARMYYKNIARKGFFILESDLAPTRLALLKFEDVLGNENSTINVDNIAYRATLPGWMQPKLAQFKKEQS